MLGFKYLFSFGLQHGVFFGILVILIGEVFYKKTAALNEGGLHLQSSLLGLSIINLSFLHYAFTEELMFMQVILSFLYASSLFLNSKKNLKLERAPSGCVYIILLILMAADLVV